VTLDGRVKPGHDVKRVVITHLVIPARAMRRIAKSRDPGTLTNTPAIIRHPRAGEDPANYR
jgi:hypothetical protein